MSSPIQLTALFVDALSRLSFHLYCFGFKLVCYDGAMSDLLCCMP